ncbi:trypsin-like peptidase domain-containing protein [Streptomyces zhihengii]|uniref:trypsin-like peptidase domain-containing protein n=1 Tax=Streptomyces zhihengii TaxID=1818004 RepID=UPI003457031C
MRRDDALERAMNGGTAGHGVHFLDRVPFDWSLPASRELRDLLCSVHYREGPVIALAQQAGISPATVHWGQPMAAVWHDLITTARNQDKLRALLDQVVHGPDTALAGRVGELLRAEPVVQAPAPPADPGTWRHFHDPDAAERRIFRTGSYLDVSFLRRGMELSTAVARLLVAFPDGRQYHGTGFRIGEDLLLTNHHVLFDDSDPARPAARAEAWFGYEADLGGRELAHVRVPCAVESAVGDPAHDWAVVRVAAPVPEGTAVVELPDTSTVAAGDRVYIVQHPQGGVKKLAAHHNVVRHADDEVVQYWTDTDHGSSGSPVFDERWRLVALHHRWVEIGPLTEPPEYRNQGIRIDRVTEGVRRTGRV